MMTIGKYSYRFGRKWGCNNCIFDVRSMRDLRFSIDFRVDRCSKDFLLISADVRGFSYIFVDFHRVSQIFADFRRFSQIFADFRRFSQIFADFRRFSSIFVDFRRFHDFFCGGAQICWKSRKTTFYVFCLFTPLDRRFRLSRASQTVDLDEIYRMVSKILDFMASGSVLSRFCVFHRF